MTRKLASAGLALSVIWAVISLVVKGGVGISRADGVLAFNITRANVDITHETANVCLNSSSFVSCQSGGAPFLCAFGFKCGFGNSFDSDSYDITANLTLFNSTEFQKDLNNDIQFALAPGNCSSFASTDDLSMAPLGTWTGNIPGGSLHKVINKNFTIYNFEGNIAAFTTGLNPDLTLLKYLVVLPFSITWNSTSKFRAPARLAVQPCPLKEMQTCARLPVRWLWRFSFRTVMTFRALPSLGRNLVP
jgi:hypothetical protein